MAGAKNKSLIGAFVVGAVALALLIVFLLGSGMLFSPKYQAVCYFEGGVGGLSVGAPVVFRGVQIGQVREISIRATTKPLRFSIPVIMEIAGNQVHLMGPKGQEGNLQQTLKLSQEELIKELINLGMRAQLSQKSFVTGELQVLLDFFPDTEAIYRGDGSIPEVPTVPSPFEKLTKSLENLPLGELVNNLVSALNGVNSLVNSKHLQALPENLDGLVRESKGLVDRLDKEIGPILKRMGETLGSYDKLARHVDAKVDPLADGMKGAMERLDKTLEQARTTLAKLERTAGPDSPAVSDLKKALNDVSAMARSVKALTDYLERHPEALIQGKGSRR